MEFRTRLLETLRAIRSILGEPGVLVGGSVVPNLLEPDARSSLVVSEDVDIVVPVGSHAAVKRELGSAVGLRPSAEEPSVWLPERPELIEVNFIGADSGARAGETYVLEDATLPLLVFGNLGLLKPGHPVQVGDLVIPVPRPAGLLVEKLLTDRSGEKGDRDLLVVMGLLLVSEPADLDELESLYRSLAPEQRYSVRSNLSVLSLLEPRPCMPDPVPHRRQLAQLLARLEQGEDQ